MLAFTMTAEQAELFFEICKDLQIDSEEGRVAVLQAMTQHGQIQNVVKTNLSKDDYAKHLAKHFGKVLKIEEKDNG